jgi:hypothetical protein
MSLIKLQGGAPVGGGVFLQRVQWDARSGVMSSINRINGANGWENDPQIIAQPFSLAMDLANIEMVWMRLINGVDVQSVKARDVIAGTAAWMPRPSDDHKEGFRVQVSNAKLFDGVREWSSTAFCVRESLDGLHTQFEAEASQHEDEVPIVTSKGRTAATTSKGTNYAPTFEITGWSSRDVFDSVPQPQDSPPVVAVSSIPAPANAVEFA